MSKNPSVTEMCLTAVAHAADVKAAAHSKDDYGDDLIALAMKVLADACREEIKTLKERTV